MKRIAGVFVAVILVLTAPNVATASQAMLFPQVTVASDYRYSGLSNSAGDPVVQASLYLWRPDNFYAGIWVSEVGFGYEDTPTYEIDIYAGRKVDFKKTELSFEVMATLFPDQPDWGPDYNFNQVIVKAKRSFDRATLKGTAAWSPDGSYGGGHTFRYEGNLQYHFSGRLAANGAFGTFISEQKQDRKFWELGLALRVDPVTIDIRYVDTDLESFQCFDTDWCDSSLVAKITYDIPLFGFRKH